jgi:hypothetical protein
MTIAFSTDSSDEVGHWEILDSHYLDTKGSELENQDAANQA